MYLLSLIAIGATYGWFLLLGMKQNCQNYCQGNDWIDNEMKIKSGMRSQPQRTETCELWYIYQTFNNIKR